MTSAAVAAPLPASIWFPGRGDFSPGLIPGLSSQEGDPSRRGLDAIQVLLIEDDPAIAEMYRIQLEFDGFLVTVATTGEIGYTNVVSGRADIVLLDLLLPDRSGLEIMADIKEKLPSHPPVVILSNYGEPSMMDRGFSLGALEYLVKSRVTPASVSQSIRGWIEQARRERSDPN
jgi:two-component system, OmpR family, copper resistance phosphate regulon response regulator CusR